MLNGTNAVLLQTILYLANTNLPNDTKISPEIENNTLNKVDNGEGKRTLFDWIILDNMDLNKFPKIIRTL